MNSTPARASPPPPIPRNRLVGFLTLTLDAAVVAMDTVAVCTVVPEIVTEAGSEQEGLSEAAEPPVRVQVSATEPPNPLEGVPLRVDFPEFPGVAMVMLPLVECAMAAFAGSATVMVEVIWLLAW